MKHGNNSDCGACKPKTGMNATVLNRAAGMAQAVSDITNKTSSRHMANKNVNYHYKGTSGYGDNENINGYGR